MLQWLTGIKDLNLIVKVQIFLWNFRTWTSQGIIPVHSGSSRVTSSRTEGSRNLQNWVSRGMGLGYSQFDGQTMWSIDLFWHAVKNMLCLLLKYFAVLVNLTCSLKFNILYDWLILDSKTERRIDKTELCT